jgi:serine/threonine protein kinase
MLANEIYSMQINDQIIVQMIQAVEDLHYKDFVHCDIKPEIFRIKDDRAFIIDLEHAREYFYFNH